MGQSRLHMMVQAPSYHKLITELYPEGDDYVTNDVVFGVKKSLVVVCVASLQNRFSCSQCSFTWTETGTRRG